MATRNERRRRAKAKAAMLRQAQIEAFEAEKRRAIIKRNLARAPTRNYKVRSNSASWPYGYSAFGANGGATKAYRAKVVGGKLSAIEIDTYARPKRPSPADWPVVNRDAIVAEWERNLALVKAWQERKQES